ncbi:MAG: hypothetical protein J0L92_02730 [Deltaproteobacteria bacterium]|nr:hypothetical protein [Deltaproteobacteria bacterium]
MITVTHPHLTHLTRRSLAALTALSLFAAPLLASVALAQDRGRPPGGHGPPAEALAACRGRTRGATCSVTPPQGGSAVRGTCDSPSDDLPLACRPEGGPGGGGGRGGPHAPPPEAFTACDDTATGDSCVLDTPHGTIEGVCRSTPDGRTACAPSRPPPPRSTP